MQKVIFFDLDGTLTPGSTWLLLNQRLGITPEEDKYLFEQYLDQKLEYNNWTKELFRIHQSRGQVTKNELVSFIETIELRPDALSTIQTLQSKGYTVVLVSGSVDLIVEEMAKRLGIVEWLACSQLAFDEKGTLSDIISTGDEADSKLGLVLNYLSHHNLSPADAVAVGDGGNEWELFKVMKGVLLGANEKLKPLAWKQVENLSEIVTIL